MINNCVLLKDVTQLHFVTIIYNFICSKVIRSNFINLINEKKIKNNIDTDITKINLKWTQILENGVTIFIY